MTQIDSLRIYFVLPTDKSVEAECSAGMKLASKLVFQYGGNAKFIKPSSCYDILPLKKDIFIFDKFEGTAFEILKQNSTKIVGVPCFTECLINGRTIPPSPYPIYMEAMRNIWVTTTGFDQKTKKYIQEKIQYMGGYFDTSLRSVITHLIAHNNLSSKAIHAFKNNIKIMKLSWIDDVWEKNLTKNVNGDDEIFSHHQSPLFHNLNITASGISKKEKDVLKQLIEKNGGNFMGNLEGNVTDILLVSKPEGEKFRVAKNWKITCVIPRWVEDCINAKAILHVKSYEMDFNKPMSSTPNKENNTVNFSANFTSNLSMITMDPNKVNTLAPEISTVNEKNSGIENAWQQSKNFSHCKNIVKSSHASIINILLKWCKDAGQFLDGLNIFLYGFQSEECEKLKKILNLGGAIRFNEMSESVTHIIVGRDDDKNLSKFSKSGAYILSIEWLVESVKIKGRAHENKYLLLKHSANPSEPPSPMSKHGAQLLSQNENTEKRNFNSIHHQEKFSHLDDLLCKYNTSEAGEPFDHKVTAGSNCSNVNGRNTNSEVSKLKNSDTTSDEFFENLTFFLSNDFSEEEIKYLEDLIVERKGQIVNGRSFGVPDYAVVPAIGALLREVTAKEVVNVYFIKDCCAEGSLLNPRYYHQPVAFVKNLLPLKNCVISVSNYYQGEREFMEMLIEALGGVAQSLLAKKSKQGALKSTHLVCADPQGQKYEGALRWGLPVVHHEWLFRCAALGIRVSEESYLIGRSKISDNELLQEISTPLLSKANNFIERISVQTNSCKTVSRATGEKIVSDSYPSKSQYEYLCKPSQTTALNNTITKIKDTETPKNNSPDPNRTITPTSPYGAFYGKGNPTPSTRKRIWKWMNQGAEFPLDPPSKLIEKELDSTPVSKLISHHLEMLKRKPEELPPDSPIYLPSKKLNLDVNDLGNSNKECVDTGFKIMKQIEENFTKNEIRSPTSSKKTDFEDRQMVVVTESQTHTEVGWEDPNEKEVVLRSLEKDAKIEFKPKIFMFSCLSEQSEIRLLIEKCGGVISSLPYFDKKATHLITGNLTRAEKLMGSIASGLWVLHPSYLDALRKTKSVYEVPEEDYEWGSPKQKLRLSLLSSNAKDFAQCSHDWRVAISRGCPPAFKNLKILLHVSESKHDSFKRLIEAGNGLVVKGTPPNYHSVDADLCVYEASNTEAINFATLAEKNIRCVALVYISDVLLKKDNAIEINLIPEFLKLWKQVQGETV